MTEDFELIQKAKKNNVVVFDSYVTSSVSHWKKRKIRELDMLREGMHINYEHGDRVDKNIISRAKELINNLPLSIFSPDFGINSDGTLLLEWARRESDGNMTMFSVILNGPEIICSLMHAGNIKHYVTALYSEYSLRMVEDILNEYFEKPINTKRSSF